ncbi:MAG: PQQ-dependent sugar dehydrogenase [Mucilaginibacter polytrichastri]|nr:PQQ-dependent sugar dehydrogenase [Mucilaginibacter polytrichastri]
MKNVTMILLGVLILASCKKKSEEQPAETGEPVSVTTRAVKSDLRQPWSVVFGADNMLWVTERGGRLLRIDPASGNSTEVAGMPTDVRQNGEGGLLGLVLHPDFPSDPRIFFAYDYDRAGVYTGKIVSYTWQNNRLSNGRTLVDQIPAAGNHNGARLAFGADKTLYFTTGDAARADNAQDPQSLSGKIMRINADGSIPADNPTAGSPVYSLGHRNPQGLVWVGNTLFSSEHGDDTDDEINIIEAGRNYGWPNVRGKCEGGETAFCSEKNVAEPIYTWTPTVAPSGMTFYNGDLIPQWKNSLLLTTLKGSRLFLLKLNAGQTGIAEVKELFNGEFGRLRDVCVAPDGRVFIISGNGAGDRLIEVSAK